MRKGDQSAHRLTSWGNALLYRLSGDSRRRRKRKVSKRRRAQCRGELRELSFDDE